MTPRNTTETLTSRQQCAFSIIVLLIFLAFSSVFAYAYLKGVQVRMGAEQVQISQAERTANMFTEGNQKRATPITCGTQGQAYYIQASLEKRAQGDWKISKIPVPNGNHLQPAIAVLAFTPYPNGWNILARGKVVVPENAEPGVYLAQCQEGDYLFRVVQKEKPQVSSHKMQDVIKD
jgi:hypothetical protein